MRALLILLFTLFMGAAQAQVTPGTSPLTIQKGGTGAATAAGARTSLGLAIGTNVEAWDADLDCLAALATTGVLQRTGNGTCTALTSAQLTALINPATASLAGLVPAFPNNTTTFLRGDLTYATLNFAALGATIGSLTLKASPVGADIFVIGDSAASGALKQTTLADAFAAFSSGVSSLNTLTGAVTTNVVLQEFFATGTYTPTAGMLHAILECVGSGAGGGSAAGSATSSFGGGGGGSGGRSMKKVTAAQIATAGGTLAVTIGAAGVGGAAGSNNGTAGAAASMGSLVIANGGAAGLFGSVAQVGMGGAGGTAGTGDEASAGMAGGWGIFATGVTTVVLPSGFGGSSGYGGGGIPVSGGSAAFTGTNAGPYGSGGSGAFANNTATTAAGGNGSLGKCTALDFVNM